MTAVPTRLYGAALRKARGDLNYKLAAARSLVTEATRIALAAGMEPAEIARELGSNGRGVTAAMETCIGNMPATYSPATIALEHGPGIDDRPLLGLPPFG